MRRHCQINGIAILRLAQKFDHKESRKLLGIDVTNTQSNNNQQQTTNYRSLNWSISTNNPESALLYQKVYCHIFQGEKRHHPRNYSLTRGAPNQFHIPREMIDRKNW